VSSVRLTLRAAPRVPLEAPCVRPDAFASLTSAEIERLPVWQGRDQARIGDFFTVEGGSADDVRVLGDVSRVKRLGEGMQGGRMVVEGRAGMHCGAAMSGGLLRIEGDAGDWAGAEMRGGVLEIRGSAGACAGAAYAGHPRGMRGGLLLVHGSAGERLGERMRRGTLAVTGGAGPCAGAHMVAGTLLVCGPLERGAGIGMKRGTLLAAGPFELLPTFRYACTDRPGFLPLLFRSLEARGFPVPGRLRSGAFRRYGGDYADLGRGEILQWTDQEP
jgi:formylmethanofuran dehydrogenase subunit C